MRSRSAARSPIPRLLPHLDQHFPSFGALVRRIGSRQIRNLGTIAGNLATASPIGDTLPCLIALDATVTLRVARRRAHAAGGSVHHRLSQDRAGGGRDHRVDPHSLACAPARNSPPTSCPSASIRTSRPSSPPSASSAQDGKVRELRAAYGGMAARAMRAASLEAAVTGRPWTPAWLADIDALLARDFTPMSDHRGGAAYRLRAAAGLLRRFQLETSLDRADAGGGAMNEIARTDSRRRARGGAPRQRRRACHRRGALPRRRAERAGHARGRAGAEPACPCAHPAHRRRRARSPRPA